MNRGEYNHKNLGRQLILFHGVQIGNITPSDIDAVIEYKDKAWVLIEVKGHGAVLPTGQRLLLERFVNDVSKAGKKACALVVEHNIANPSENTLSLSNVFSDVCIIKDNGEHRRKDSSPEM